MWADSWACLYRLPRCATVALLLYCQRLLSRTVGASRFRFAPAIQFVPTRASCTYSFQRSYVANKTTVAQRGNLYKHAQPSAHNEPPNLGYHLLFRADCWSSLVFWHWGTPSCSPATSLPRRLPNLLQKRLRVSNGV